MLSILTIRCWSDRRAVRLFVWDQPLKWLPTAWHGPCYRENRRGIATLTVAGERAATFRSERWGLEGATPGATETPGHAAWRGLQRFLPGRGQSAIPFLFLPAAFCFLRGVRVRFLVSPECEGRSLVWPRGKHSSRVSRARTAATWPSCCSTRATRSTASSAAAAPSTPGASTTSATGSRCTTVTSSTRTACSARSGPSRPTRSTTSPPRATSRCPSRCPSTRPTSPARASCGCWTPSVT